MTRKLNDKVKIARAVCRLKCGRGVKVGEIDAPKPQKGRNEVRVGTKTKGGGAYIDYKNLSEEQKKMVMSSGISNVGKEKAVNYDPPYSSVLRMSYETQQKLLDEGVWIKYGKKGQKQKIKNPSGKASAYARDLVKKARAEQDKVATAKQKAIDDEKKARNDERVAKENKRRADMKARLEAKLDGTPRQIRATVIQLNKKFGTKLNADEIINKKKGKKAPAPPPEPKKVIKKKVKKSVIEAKKKKVAPKPAPKKAPAKAKAPAKPKKERSAKQKANDKKLGAMNKKKEEPAPKPKRKRRTKAEMEEARKNKQ